ncbi:MAG: flagellar hook-associated protein FlgL [candidate division Zixibacteria bacterium]|nr:flagellar hook-associated protein FlgL [candidate division Zixibacteria bacterium]
MRITNGMIADRVVFNMQRSISRYMNLQTRLSTGRILNKPSDDPIGVQRALVYRTELAKNEQYSKTVHQAQSWMGTYDMVLSDLKNLVSNAKEIAVAMANGNYDDVTRQGSAEEVSSILERLVQLGNSELEGRFVFSGHRTQQKALSVSANGVVYDGNDGLIEYQIESSSRMGINLVGSDVFLAQVSTLGEDADLGAGVTDATLLSDLHNAAGIDQDVGTFTVIDENLGLSVNVDVSAMVTVGDLFDPVTGVNAQLVAGGITNVELKLGAEGNNLLLDTLGNGTISTTTELDRINNGHGLDLLPGNFIVTDGAAVNIQIDVSGATSIGDVITAFNTQMAAAGYATVTMSINAGNTGLDITDSTGTLGFSVDDVSPERATALGLGIRGTIDPVLSGTDLEPIPSIVIEETTGTTASDLGILGTHTGDFSGNDLDPRMLATTNIADLQNGNGMEFGRLVIHQGETTRTIDLSSSALVTIQDVLDVLNNSGIDITASINSSSRGIQIVSNDTDASFIIDCDTTDETAKQMQLWGSSDTMGSMILLHTALENNDQEGVGMLLANMDDSMQHLLNLRAGVGSKSIRLEGTLSRITDLELNFTSLLSDTEDADITELVTQLAVYENNYQAALMATARIVQPSLMDFLR